MNVATGPNYSALDVAAQEEDHTYGFNRVRYRIRAGQVPEALQALATLQAGTEPFVHLLPQRLIYLFLYSRARI